MMLLSMEEFRTFAPTRPTYALFGWPLGHTMSPALHALLFELSGHEADYIAVAVPPEALHEAFTLAKSKLCGLNLTIPHKKAILALLDEVSEDARQLSSCNTVAFRAGRAVGCNTDLDGFAASLARDRVRLRGKRVLLLGYGGAASVLAYHCLKEGASLTITGRNLTRAQALQQQLHALLPGARIAVYSPRHLPRDLQIVVNATPVGMFPHEDERPLRQLPHKIEYIFDAIYNPPITALLGMAHPKKTRTRDGLYMLVMQAVHAQTFWTGAVFSQAACDSVLRKLYAQLMVKRLHEKYGKRSIALCGFMGSGKTTLGRKLARLTGLRFVDADHYLEEQENTTISEIFAQHGEAYFRQLEARYVAQLARQPDIVLSLGGGAVLREDNVKVLREHCLVAFLDTPYSRIVRNLQGSTTRPLLKRGDAGRTMRKLYNARKPIYQRASHLSVRSARISETLELLLKKV